MFHIDDGRRTTDDGRQTAEGGKQKAEDRRTMRLVWLSLLCITCLALAGCSPKMSWQAMAAQPRYEPLEPNNFFPDGTSSRPLVQNTVPRGFLREDTAYYTGKTTGADGKATDVDQFPVPVTRELVQRGQERYNIYCTPCHAADGQGNGVVVQRGFAPPPSLHDPRLRQSPVGHFYDVITNGWGQMPNYAHQIPVGDRWAIVAYIRALQLSQNANAQDLSPEERTRLDAGE